MLIKIHPTKVSIMRATLTVLLISILMLPNMGKTQGWEQIYHFDSSPRWADFTQMPDEGFAIAALHGGNTDSYSIIRTNRHGDVIWNKTYSSEQAQHTLGKIVSTEDGGLVLLGSKNTGSSGDIILTDFFLRKYDDLGDLVWEKTFSNTSGNDISSVYGFFLTKTIDEEFILVGGHSNVLAINHTSIIRADSEGNELWRSNYDFDLLNYYSSIDQTIDGDLIGGFFDVSDEIYATLKLNSSGQESIPLSSSNIIIDIVSTSSGGCLLLKADSIIQLDANGINQNTIALPNAMTVGQYSKITRLADNSYMLFDDSGYPSSFTKFTPTLEMLWQQSFESNLLTDERTTIRPTSDLGCALLSIHEGFLRLYKTNEEGTLYTHSICGTVFIDDNENCSFESNEDHLWDGWIIETTNANGSKRYTTTDEDGAYCININQGTYTIRVEPASSAWNSCIDQQISIDDNTENPVIHLGIQQIADCPVMNINIGSDRFRPCMESNLFFYYENTGSLLAEGVYLEVQLPTHLTVSSSPIPFINLGNNRYQFQLENLLPGEDGTFAIVVDVACDVEVGSALCIDAHIYPDDPCIDSWNGAILEVTGACNEEEVQFTIRNIGNAAMSNSTTYYVIEDNIILMQDPVLLDFGGQEQISVPITNNSTYRLEVEQEEGIPSSISGPKASMSIENCNGLNPGWVTAFADDAIPPYLDEYCLEVTASFDPNDKQALPRGVDEPHYISKNTPLEYTIRFQNTGTDTAFLVVLRDTISEFLDVASFRPGVASHPYTYSISDYGELKFRFENILLPDSTTNEIASNGFVQFSIQQQKDLPIGTVIYNKAGIYFDFNAPVITNETWHTIGENYLEVLNADREEESLLPVTVSPNPFKDELTINWQRVLSSGGELKLYNVQGWLVKTIPISGQSIHLNTQQFSSGIYFYRLEHNQQLLSQGKILKQ